jgi:hypothetical protein
MPSERPCVDVKTYAGTERLTVSKAVRRFIAEALGLGCDRGWIAERISRLMAAKR